MWDVALLFYLLRFSCLHLYRLQIILHLKQCIKQDSFFTILCTTETRHKFFCYYFHSQFLDQLLRVPYPNHSGHCTSTPVCLLIFIEGIREIVGLGSCLHKDADGFIEEVIIFCDLFKVDEHCSLYL